MIKTLFLHEIARCLLLYQVHIFRSSVTGMPPLFLYHKSHSETIAAWSGIHCVESQMILTILSFFITWYAGAFSKANNIFFRVSVQIWDELITSCFFWLLFFTISGASNLHFSWTCSRLGLLTVVRASSSSFLFCI